MVYRMLIWLLCSQIFYLGVFSLSLWAVYVVNESENLCWEFTRWNQENPNWLKSWWFAVNTNETLGLDFSTTDACISDTVENCCKSLWFRYAGIPVGIQNISKERKWAEYLASKNIIQSHSLDANAYLLWEKITRKEVMKVILNASGIIVDNNCKEIFQDVDNDWGCKYIETALENQYIIWNESFRPNSDITKTEALKLIFKARNIDKSYTTDSWQQDYISTALYLWFIDEKFSNYNEIATRGWIFAVLSKTYPDFKNY